MKKLFIVLAFITVLLVSCEEFKAEKNVTMHIISVGLDYQNSTVASSLRGTVADALEVGTSLSEIMRDKNVNAETIFLIQEGPDSDRTDPLYPTWENIKTAIEGMTLKENDLLVFFYSGHGQNTDTGGFLVGGWTDEHPMYDEMDMDTMFKYFDSLPCRTVVLLDACFSGVFSDNASNSDTSMADAIKTIMQKRDYKDVAALVSSTSYQTSLVSVTERELPANSSENQFEPHGLFTIALLKAIGWKHSIVTKTFIEAMGEVREIDGYQSSTPARMSVDELCSKIMEGWSSTSQTPTRNGTVLKTMIIP